VSSIRKREWLSPKGELKTAWLVDYRDSAGARRSKQFARKRDAEAWSTKASWEVSQGVHTADSQSITVKAAADMWIGKALAEGRERSTVKQYRELARLHIVPLLGAEKLSKLTTPAVENFKDSLMETRSRAMAAKTIRALSSILIEAQRRGLVAQNVARGVRVTRPSRDKKHVTIPNRDELRALLSAAEQLTDHPEMHPLIMTVIFAGLRSSELRGLSWGDVDLKGRTIAVSQRADRWGEIGSPKSDAGRRSVPIGPALANELRSWKLKSRPNDLGLVFPNDAGKPIWQSHLHEHYFAVEAAAKLAVKRGARFGLHCLRHAAASSWIRQGVDLKRLQVWMGHSTIQITVDTYGHLMADAQADANLASEAEAALLG
jgi:integrase